MRINTNMAALNAWRSMSANNGNMTKSLEKLSSGYRINRAADDAAGLAVSEKMRAQIRGTNQAIKNSQDGISLLQTAEGALTETHSMLQRMRELAVQSSTATLQDSDRALLQEEFSQLQNEITRIGDATKFNGRGLLDGSAGVSVTQTAGPGAVSNMSGTGDTQSGTYNITASTKATAGEIWLSNATGAGATVVFASASDVFDAAQDITVNGRTYSVTTSTTAQQFIDAVNADSAATGVTASFDAGGAIKFTTNAVGSAQTVDVSTTIGEGVSTVSAADSAIAANAGASATDSGVDATITLAGHTYVAEGDKVTITSGNAKGLSFVLTTAGAFDLNVGTNGSLSIQTGSQSGQALSISISDMRASALGVSNLSIATQSGASSAISTLDNAINTVSTQRAKLGALQNRLEYTVSSLSTTSENLSAAESRIRDVDMAAEMANFTKFQILSQASTAMLAQANQSTQGVLSLLR